MSSSNFCLDKYKIVYYDYNQILFLRLCLIKLIISYFADFYRELMKREREKQQENIINIELILTLFAASDSSYMYINKRILSINKFLQCFLSLTLAIKLSLIRLIVNFNGLRSASIGISS